MTKTEILFCQSVDYRALAIKRQAVTKSLFGSGPNVSFMKGSSAIFHEVSQRDEADLLIAWRH